MTWHSPSSGFILKQFSPADRNKVFVICKQELHLCMERFIVTKSKDSREQCGPKEERAFLGTQKIVFALWSQISCDSSIFKQRLFTWKIPSNVHFNILSEIFMFLIHLYARKISDPHRASPRNMEEIRQSTSVCKNDVKLQEFFSVDNSVHMACLAKTLAVYTVKSFNLFQAVFFWLLHKLLESTFLQGFWKMLINKVDDHCAYFLFGVLLSKQLKMLLTKFESPSSVRNTRGEKLFVPPSYLWNEWVLKYTSL